MSKYRMTVPEHFRLVLLAGLLAVPPAGYAGSVEGGEQKPCAVATAVDLNSSLRVYDDNQGEPLFVKLEVPSAGIISIDVTVPGTAPAEPKLGFAGPGCGVPGGHREPVVLERSVTHLVLVAQGSGPHLFRVASEDPQLPLHELKLRTGFVPDAAPRQPWPKGGEDEEEIEIEPNPVVYAGQDESRSLHAKLHELCRWGEIDDHGDSFTCATLLSPGQDMVGEIRNGWGDDGDVFRFVLGSPQETKLRTLAIETIGDLDTFGALYDRSGQQLEKGDGGGNGSNFRIVRTLGPGTYFVRVEGRDGAEGLYALRVRASPW
ncbi:MAG: hypothetical protein GY856_19950 [bacterium]|nr:hypothetical protein [bacterium]